MTANGDVVISDNPPRRRYQLTIGDQMAMLTYKRTPGVIELIHTAVPTALQHHGLANALAKRALDDARAAQVRVIATCPYVQAFLREHPEYESLIGSPHRGSEKPHGRAH